jgi:ubiquinone biosynthesis protein
MDDHNLDIDTHPTEDVSVREVYGIVKRLPDFPEIMDKANQALSFLASGQIPQNSNSFTALNEKRSEMTAFRNQSIVGLLLLVIFGLVVF